MLDLSNDEYLRQRLNPRPGDEFYIPLVDTLLALRLLTPFDASRVLDFGCGGSPYRSLFGRNYLRADIEANPDHDITIGEDSNLPSDIGEFDLVLSTQVLEHVEDPSQYLNECYRVLAPNGVLVLSTHGLFEDHGSPSDYWRWTAAGLKLLTERHGLVVERVVKITCGPRAVLFLLERDLRMMGPGREILKGFPTLFAAMRLLGHARRHVWVDEQHGSLRVCDAEDRNAGNRYVGVALRARRPAL